MKPWLQNGKKIYDGSQPILCDECPCEDCKDDVDEAVREYIAANPGWSVQKTQSTTYRCAKWRQEESGSWTLVSKASGTLLVIGSGSDGASILTGSSRTAIYAKELSDGTTYRTFFCNCAVNGHSCKFISSQMEGRIIGALAPRTDEPYLPAYTCACDPCSIARLKITYCANLLSGTTYGEGFYDTLTGGSTYSYTRFSVALLWTDATGKHLGTIPCNCTSEDVSVGTHTVLHLYSKSGICSTGLSCSEQVDYLVKALTTEQNYTKVKSQSCNFTCARWSGDTLISKASGNLVVRSCTNDVRYLFRDCVGHTCTYAVEVVNNDDGVHYTYYCSCEINTSGTCGSSTGMGEGRIMGTLPVIDKPEEEYTKEDSCAVDLCEIAKLKTSHAASYVSGTTLGEGYVDRWTGEEHSISTYAFVPFRAAFKWTESGTTYLATMPCECVDQFLSVTTLTSGSIAHEYEGACDLEGTCELQMIFQNRYYQDEGWAEIGLWHADYGCPVWNEETSTYTKPASGNLIVVANRPTTISGDTISYDTFVSAATLYKDNAYLTIGCRCNYANHACSHVFASASGYCVVGMMPVWTLPEGYDPGTYACYVGRCDAVKLILDAWGNWFSGAVTGEGYLETIDATTKAYNYDTHIKALQITSSDVRYAWRVPCDCDDTGISYLYAQTLTDGQSIHTASTICTTGVCPQMVALKQSAADHGWTWHDEGRLYHKTRYRATSESEYVYTDFYDIEAGTTCLCGAVTGDGIAYTIACGCGSIVQHNLPADDSPTDYYLYLDITGACTCYDDRQILLQNPSQFGVEDIEYGSHTKYKYGSENYVSCVTSPGGGWLGPAGDLFLDYRTFCVIYKCIADDWGTTKIMYRVRRISPTGSPVGSARVGTYSSASFCGHLVPFAQDADMYSGIGWWWAGTMYEWASTCAYKPSFSGLDEETAKQIAAQIDDGCGINVYTNSFSGGEVYVEARVVPPQTGKTLHTGRYWYDSESQSWSAIRGYYTEGVERTRSSNVVHILYREQFIQTNKGIMRYGNSGYEESFLAYGYQTSSGYPSTTCSSDCPPKEDTTITATLIDDSMHGCSDDDDWDWSESD